MQKATYTTQTEIPPMTEDDVAEIAEILLALAED
jgi:hypothetical protein